MYTGSTKCDAAHWEYQTNEQHERYRKLCTADMALISLASRRPEEQDERLTRKLIVLAVGQTLI